jgi:hypothetical protein
VLDVSATADPDGEEGDEEEADDEPLNDELDPPHPAAISAMASPTVANRRLYIRVGSSGCVRTLEPSGAVCPVTNSLPLSSTSPLAQPNADLIRGLRTAGTKENLAVLGQLC